MKINFNFPGLNISAKGLSIQRKKMNIIAENIAKADSIRGADGKPYQRKSLVVEDKQNPFASSFNYLKNSLKLKVTEANHITAGNTISNPNVSDDNLQSTEITDKSSGELVYMPDNPYADQNGYVETSNVNIVTEMVDMIAATRSYESNLTALNSTKQIIKDTLSI